MGHGETMGVADDDELHGLLRALSAGARQPVYAPAVAERAAMDLSPDERLRRLKSIVATAIARKLDAEPAALARADSTIRIRDAETEWLRSQTYDPFTLSRLVLVALAIGCEVSIDVEQSIER